MAARRCIVEADMILTDLYHKDLCNMHLCEATDLSPDRLVKRQPPDRMYYSALTNGRLVYLFPNAYEMFFVLLSMCEEVRTDFSAHDLSNKTLLIQAGSLGVGCTKRVRTLGLSVISYCIVVNTRIKYVITSLWLSGILVSQLALAHPFPTCFARAPPFRSSAEVLVRAAVFGCVAMTPAPSDRRRDYHQAL